jgi:signal transduction histidine kinase
VSRRLLLSGVLAAVALAGTSLLAGAGALRAIRLQAESQVREILGDSAAGAAARAERAFADWLAEAGAAPDAWSISDDGSFANPPEPVPFDPVRVSRADPGEHAFYLREGERAEHVDEDLTAARGFYRLAAADSARRPVRLLALSRGAAAAARAGDAPEAARLWSEVAHLAGGTELLLVAATEGAPAPEEELVRTVLRHLGGHRDGRVEGYARQLGLADRPEVAARRRDLARMERLRPHLLPLPPEGEPRWTRLDDGGAAVHSGDRVLQTDESALAEVLGREARLPWHAATGDARLRVEVPGAGALRSLRFRSEAGREEVERTVRRQAAIVLSAVGLAGVVVIVALGFLIRGVRREAELARLKSEFVANVSHDLRAPLSLIRLYAETMRTGRVPEGEDGEYAAVVEREAVTLSRLVDRVLDFARIERGTKEYRLEEGDLTAFVSEFGEDAPALWRELELSVEVPADATPARFDREALAGALGNLLENAARHCGGGGVVLRLRTAGDEARIEVLDRGPGVPPAEAERIFERFHRGADAVSRATRGSGLGLTLVRHAARSLGGEAGHEPRAGGGSVFFVQLPVGGEK